MSEVEKNVETSVAFLQNVDELRAYGPIYSDLTSDAVVDSALSLAMNYRLKSEFLDRSTNLLLQLALGEWMHYIETTDLSREEVQYQRVLLHRTQLYIAIEDEVNHAQVESLKSSRFTCYHPLLNPLIDKHNKKYKQIIAQGRQENIAEANELKRRYQNGEYFNDWLDYIGVCEPIDCEILVCSKRTLGFSYNNPVAFPFKDVPIIIMPINLINSDNDVRHEVTHIHTLEGNMLGGEGYMEGWTDIVSGSNGYPQHVSVVDTIAKCLDSFYSDTSHLEMQMLMNKDDELAETIRQRFLEVFGLEGFLLIQLMGTYPRHYNIPPKHAVIPSPTYVNSRLTALAGLNL